jgi:hypothetical protein
LLLAAKTLYCRLQFAKEKREKTSPLSDGVRRVAFVRKQVPSARKRKKEVDGVEN